MPDRSPPPPARRETGKPRLSAPGTEESREEYPWDGVTPVAPDWHLERRTRWGMVIPGVLLLGGGLIVMAASSSPSSSSSSYSSSSGTFPDGNTEGVLIGLNAAIGGAVLAGFGIFRGYPYVVPGPAEKPESERMPDDDKRRSIVSGVRVLPVFAKDGAGLGAALSF